MAEEPACPEDINRPSGEAALRVLAVDDHGRGYIVRKVSLRQPGGEPWTDKPLVQPALPALRLEGVISSAGKALAIIGGGFYRKGDCIGGFLITDILRDRVLLEKGGKKAPLVLR